MKRLFETIKGIKVLVTAKTIKGTSFVGIRGYENKFGEIANLTLLVGFDYPKMLKKDKEKLLNLNLNPIIEKYGEKVAKTALEELLISIEKRSATEQEKDLLRKQNDETIKRSDAQINAYTNLATGVKLHNETNQIHITGIALNKKVIKKGIYKIVKSRPKTLAKNEIKKLADLKHTKIRTFILKHTDTVKLKGVEV